MSHADYTDRQHASDLRSHTWRTAQNSAAYLLPYLKPDMTILDVGCGPGTITADLAANYVPKGHVTGLDVRAYILETAAQHAAERGVTNITFTSGDAHSLPFLDAVFDVVHAHQVLQHVGDPVQVLREMRRVTKPDGIVAARALDQGGMILWPEIEGLQEWPENSAEVFRANGGEPNAGRRLHSWAMQAGFAVDNLILSAGTWCFYTPEERKWWSELRAERTLLSNFATTALKHGIFTQEGLEKAAEAWRKWGMSDEAWCTYVHGELIAKV